MRAPYVEFLNLLTRVPTVFFLFLILLSYPPKSLHCQQASAPLLLTTLDNLAVAPRTKEAARQYTSDVIGVILPQQWDPAVRKMLVSRLGDAEALDTVGRRSRITFFQVARAVRTIGRISSDQALTSIGVADVESVVLTLRPYCPHFLGDSKDLSPVQAMFAVYMILQSRSSAAQSRQLPLGPAGVQVTKTPPPINPLVTLLVQPSHQMGLENLDQILKSLSL